MNALFSAPFRLRVKGNYWLAVPIALGSIWSFSFDRAAGYAWQDLPPQIEGQQFRIILGLKDTQPRAWQGKIEVTGAEIVSLGGWRFSMQDRAHNDGTFNFTTKMQPLEDQLREGSYYGQTGMEGQPVQRQVPEGLLLKIRGSASTRVTLVSGSSRLEFAAGDVAYGARLFLMEGNASVEKLPMERRISDLGAANDQPAATVTPEGAVWMAWVAYRDKSDIVMASDGSRGYSIGERGDLHAPAI